MDVILAYIDSTYSLTGTERQEVVNQVVTYIKSFSSGRLYLRSLISVDKNGYIYRDNSKESILQSVVTMIVCDVPLTIKGTRVSIRIPVKYVFDLINSDTDVQMSIDAIPIYTKDKVEFTDESVNFESSTLTIDVTKMTLQFFTIIANNYTHKYGKEFGDYLNFVVLNEEQFNELSNSGDFPGMIKQIIEGNNDLRKYSQTLENDTVSIEGLSEGDYVVAYYNIAGISKPYPIRVSDNIIKITDSGLSLVKLRLD